MGNISKSYKNYLIYSDYNTGKYGIRDTDVDATVIKCVFDNIEFHEQSNLVIFSIQKMQAVCSVEDIVKLYQ